MQYIVRLRNMLSYHLDVLNERGVVDKLAVYYRLPRQSNFYIANYSIAAVCDSFLDCGAGDQIPVDFNTSVVAFAVLGAGLAAAAILFISEAAVRSTKKKRGDQKMKK